MGQNTREFGSDRPVIWKRRPTVRAGRHTLILSAAVVSAVLWGGCRKEAGEAEKSKKAAARLPAIRITSKAKLLFTFKEGDSFRTVDAIDKVPVYARGLVKVMDPSVKGVGGQWVYVADLCKPDKKGVYRYAVVELSRFEAADPAGCSGDVPLAGLKAGGAEAGRTGAGRTGVGGRGRKVIMYMTTTCPVCLKAEQFLKARGIPYVNKDVGSDPRAARELAMKAARAGFSARGVPVFDIGGRLVRGFDPATIERLVRTGK
jgi:glutaredoxin